MKILVLLIGAQGSGKTTYCKEKLPGYFRISQDDQGKGHWDIYRKALERNEQFIVIDRTNFDKGQRVRYLKAAKEKGYTTKIIWLNIDKEVCIERAKNRRGHPTLKPDDVERAISMYFKDLKYPSKKEADDLVIVGNAPYYVKVKDICEEIEDRRHIIIGDVHGCYIELMEMLETLEYNPDEDVLIFVGDLLDRGPDVAKVVDFVMSQKRAYCVLGNHEEKGVRVALGKVKKLTHGIHKTLESYNGKIPDNVLEYIRNLPIILKTPSGYVVHAGFDPTMPPEEQNKADCIYMRKFGGLDYFDENGVDWWKLWDAKNPRVFFGHVADPAGPDMPHVVSLDGGCVFGKYLKAWDSRTGTVTYINAKKVYSVSDFDVAATYNHEAVVKREEYVASGNIRSDRSDSGDLAIYTYTDNCVYARIWDDITKNSRGHIFNMKTGEPVAYALPKFFNLGENPENEFNVLPWSEGYDIYEKMDGWLGILYREDGKFKVASRGSFHSDGATWATEFIQKKDLSCLPDDVTLVFEIINEQQKIILKYDESNLVILAAFNRYTGEEYGRCIVEEWSKKIGLPIVKKYDDLTIHDCLALQKVAKDREGFVIRFSNGHRVKVKMEWYCQIAKLMSDLSPIAVWESMRKGKVLESYLVQIPEELRSLAESYRDVLEAQYKKVYDRDVEVATKCVKMFEPHDRKGLALYLQEKVALKEIEPFIMKLAFAIATNRPEVVEGMIMDHIYPRGNDLRAHV